MKQIRVENIDEFNRKNKLSQSEGRLLFDAFRRIEFLR